MRDLLNVKTENFRKNLLMCAKRTDKHLFAYSPIGLFAHKCQAFTLAEVLITLAVIGVVAAITMPMLITNINDRVNFERHANIAYKVTQAMEQMRAHGKLVQYTDTNAFVDELQKYLKIQKRCSASNIAECWPTETVIDADGNEYNVSDAKQRKNLLSNITTDDKDDNNVGLILADGASIILTYNKNTEPIDIGTRVTATKLPTSSDKQVAYTITPTTSSIDFLTDVNGKKGPNAEGKDIKSFSSAHFAKSGHACDDGPEGCLYLVPTYTPINCCTTSANMATAEFQAYCGSGFVWEGTGCTQDRWAGANKACKEAGMNLLSTTKLQALYSKRSSYSGNNASLSSMVFSYSGDGWFWAAEENPNNPQVGSAFVDLSNGSWAYANAKGYNMNALCIKE